MQPTEPPQRADRTRELARVLRARQRRTRLLRRRVTAIALILLASMWGVVVGLGSMGATTHTATATLADLRSTPKASSSGSTTHHAARSSKAATAQPTATAAAKSATTATTTTAASDAAASDTTTSTSTTATTAASTATTASSTATAVTTSQS